MTPMLVLLGPESEEFTVRLVLLGGGRGKYRIAARYFLTTRAVLDVPRREADVEIEGPVPRKASA